ncbi:MAG TPA: transglycosylase SLT domain-containing protein [Candidatus Binatia bacterium]|nr:transglycosylase SLT domain-containing protein [Candidatus Binatia bacterium]
MLAAAKRLLAIFILPAFPFVSFAETPNPRENFAKAYASYSSGSLAQAKDLFQQALEPDFSLADYSLYYLALISFKEGNFDAARQFLSQLRRRYPQSIWVHPAELQRARIDLAEKRYTQASEALRSLRTEKGVRPEIVDEAIFLQAQAQEAVSDLSQAHGLYSELRTLFPRSRWAAPARSALKRLREKYPDQFGLNTAQAIGDEGDRLVREREYNEAEVLFKKLLGNNPEPNFRLRILTKLTDLYLSIRKRNEAIPLLEQIARDYPKSPEAPKALYQIGQILWNRHDNAQALDYFRQVMERYPTSPYFERSRYAAADIYESFGRKQDAIALYTSIIKSFPNSQVHDDAASRLAWLYYRDGEWRQAYTAFQSLAGHAKDNAFRTAGMYWQGRSAEKLGDAETAIRIYRQIVDGSEESYYQALALRALVRAGVAVEESKISTPPPATETDPPMNAAITYHLSRARELSAISLHRLAVAELSEVERLSKKHSLLRPLLMHEYFSNQAYGRSLAIANQLPSSQSERNLYRFPLAYWEMIQQKAQERELDPYLILALIRQESLFDPQARSPAAALGLMQLLPSTASRIAKQIGVAPPSNEQLFQPETNLVLGTQYLKDLLQRYSNDWFKAIAAYNAGEAAVDRWEKEILTDDGEEFVERIPYLETRGYVKLVMRNHRIYKLLYDQQK